MSVDVNNYLNDVHRGWDDSTDYQSPLALASAASTFSEGDRGRGIGDSFNAQTFLGLDLGTLFADSN